MPDANVETVEPDPAATSIGNDQTINKDSSEVAASIPGVDESAKGSSSLEAAKDEEPASEEPKDQPPAIRKSIEADPDEEKKEDVRSDGDSRENRQMGRDNKNWRPRRDYSSNVKSDFASQKESSNPTEIRKQMEFYFSDSNLPLDKFLYDKVGGPANRPVPIKLLHSFKRMRHFQPYSAVVDALKESDFLEVTENEEVRRKVPLDESTYGESVEDGRKKYEDHALARSIYAKGFGEETSTTQFDIEAFFAQYGRTNAIRLRRTQEKLFKGSVFVEFDTEETQKAFLELDPKPKWNGRDLVIKSKHEYVEGKNRDIESGKIKPTGEYGRRNHNRAPGDERDWRERRDEDRKRGFRDNRGRGGRGNRGRGRGRGSRGRDREGRGEGRDGRDREEKKGRDPHQVPKVQITGEFGSDAAAINKSERNVDVKDKDATDHGDSKKRPRDEAEAAEGQPETKKVDTKE